MMKSCGIHFLSFSYLSFLLYVYFLPLRKEIFSLFSLLKFFCFVLGFIT